MAFSSSGTLAILAAERDIVGNANGGDSRLFAKLAY
jgi:hypothetical protein